MIFLIVVLISLLNLSGAIIKPRALKQDPIHGTERAREFPYMVLVLYAWDNAMDSIKSCGGTIIHKEWVLTAAHCVEEIRPNVGPNRNVVIAGRDRFYGQEYMGQFITSEDIFMHPDYINGFKAFLNRKKTPLSKYLRDLRRRVHDKYVGDIALIKLSEPLKLIKSVVEIAKLPVEDTEPSGEVKVAGWGARTWGPKKDRPTSMANTLRAADFFIYNRKACNQATRGLAEEDGVTWYTNYTIEDSQICTIPMFTDSGVSGDSGGGLISMEEIKDVPVVVGIVSYTWYPCGRPGAVSIYTKVSHYISWIEKTIKYD